MTRALTHKSASQDNNERLEFLGDAVLGYVIAEHLHRTRQGEQEDLLTLARASLVNRKTLAHLARELALGDYLILGSGELKSGGHNRDSILADALEGVIGAVHEDGGVEAARALLERLFEQRLREVDARNSKDPKTELQEHLQARSLPLPEYAIVGTEGLDHERVFEVSCEVALLQLRVTATGSSRKDAEKRAAAMMLQEFERK